MDRFFSHAEQNQYNGKYQLYGQCNAEMVSSAVTGVAFHPVALNRVYKNAAKSE